MSDATDSLHDSATHPAPPGGGPLAWALQQELMDELRGAARHDTPPVRPDDLLRRQEEGLPPGRDVASLLFENHLRRGGEAPASAPESAGPSNRPVSSLASLLSRNDLLGSPRCDGPAAPRTGLPGPGDTLLGFRLLRELGRGAFARVYLAEQADLAGRPVVVKVSAVRGAEPQLLAQLQHTHIVPVYSVHEDAASGVRALCMPFFGGASLSDVLRALHAKTPRPARGADLVAALDEVGAPVAGNPAASGESPRDVLARLPYAHAAAWVVARLAEGLEHAHARGVLHRDVKPSNALLTADGQAMLLDFNLAEEGDVDPAHATLAGTVAYMAPEHLQALARRDPALARRVDHRADVYALGMVLFEMLAGSRPFDQSGSYAPLPVLIEAMAVERGRTVPSVRRARPDVPWGLESVVRKCLAPDPNRRYQRAGELAEDLRRFLADRPLRHAPELSSRERAAKWRRRHPRLTAGAAVASVAATALLAAGLLLAGVWGRLADTGGRLAEAQARERMRRYEDGTVRALCLVNTQSDLQDHLARGQSVCEETLGLYGVLDGPGWREPDDWALLGGGDRRRLAEDTRELLLLLAGAKVRLGGGARGAVREALGLADRAAEVPGLPACRAVWEDRAGYRAALGDAAGAAADRAAAGATPAAGARDHYLLAMTCAREGRLPEAVRHLDEAVRLNPRHYWSWLQRGLVRQAQGDPALAAGDFQACVALWPDFAWGHFNRGCALAQWGRRAEAVDAYTRALEQDPGLVPAFVNRGLARLELGADAGALDDFDAAAGRGRGDAVLHSGRGVALERLGRHAEADAAFAAAAGRADLLPAEARARLRWVYGFAVAARLPGEAAAAFAEVLREEPRQPQALYGAAMLADRAGRNREALGYYTRALEAAPGFAEARRFRAVLLARTGDAAAARREIDACLTAEPASGAVHYAAACVHALACARGGDAARALDHLRRAFALGYGADRAADDADLAAVRGRPEFRRLIGDARRGPPAGG
jgi:serine/threonine protein kinase/tetratricopeptide (TPR) repeat protein